jgi:hypothetical protein
MAAAREHLPGAIRESDKRAMNPRYADEVRKLWRVERRALRAQKRNRVDLHQQSAGVVRSFGKGPNLDKPARYVPLFEGMFEPSDMLGQQLLPISTTSNIRGVIPCSFRTR